MAQTGSTAQTLGATWDRSMVSTGRAVQLVRTSYEASGVDIEDYAHALIENAESPAERARRAAARRRLDILHDAHGALIKAALKNWLTPSVYYAVVGANEDHIDISRNPAKRIWEEMASLYNRPPKRSAKSGFKKFSALVKGTRFDLFWRDVELALQACNQVLIWPEVITRPDGERAVKHRYACPDTFSVVASPDDPTELEALVLIDQWVDLAGEGRKRYILWTHDWHGQWESNKGGRVTRTGRIEPVEDEGIDPDANPYGRMVHTLISRGYTNDSLLDQTSGEDLVNLTVGNGERRCILRYTEKMSGFKQLIAHGASVDKPPQQLLDPGAVGMVTVSDGGVKVVDWQVDIEKQQRVYDRDEERAAASRGINAQTYKSTGDYQSAVQARGSERGLAERRIGEAPIWQDAERVYAQALALVARVHGMESPPPDDIELEVQHAPVEYPTDPREQAELDKTRISLGLESAVTICQREHPEWTPEQCEKFIETNLDVTAKINDMKTRHNVPDNPETDGRAAEVNGQMGGRPPNDQPEDDNRQSPPGAAPGRPNAPEEQP